MVKATIKKGDLRFSNYNNSPIPMENFFNRFQALVGFLIRFYFPCRWKSSEQKYMEKQLKNF